ncbi:3'-5' exonuclease [Lysinibacillus telephonicus]|uniref:3'-5' exonuclease n=1 Tax=Lysinibacillus telephonicus TaxID=1714840 RepID=UPI0031FCD874
MRKYTYIFLDIEAALIHGKQHIIEIGAIKLLPNGTRESFSKLIQPNKFKKLNSHIQKLTGIKTEELITAASFKEVMKKFMDWCSEDTIFVAFGEFDRKVLEEELIRNNLDVSFIYPIIDFQQKYMIANQLKDQPSLSSLLNAYQIEVKTQHRALADAFSLYKIFEAANGAQIIENQKTNKFGIIISDLRQMDDFFNLSISFISGNVSSTEIEITSIKNLNKHLHYDIIEQQRETEEGEKEIIQRTQIYPDHDVQLFLENIIQNLKNKVLITRSGLKQLSRIIRLHHCVIPKTEVMTLHNILQNEDLLNEFTLIDEFNEFDENRIHLLLKKNENLIIDEFKKRDLLIREKILI